MEEVGGGGRRWEEVEGEEEVTCILSRMSDAFEAHSCATARYGDGVEAAVFDTEFPH